MATPPHWCSWRCCGNRPATWPAPRRCREAADQGDIEALRHLAGLREEAGDPAGAETLARRAADEGDTEALRHVAGLREQAGDPAGAETL